MHKLVWMCGISMLGACAAAPDDTAAPAGAGNDATGVATQASFAYWPMGFARITDSGGPGGPGVSVGFDSLSALPVTVAGGGGSYTVTFPGLGVGGTADATGGNVQVTAEGTGNTRCRITSWLGAPDLGVNVQCTTPAGALAASGFAVLFFRYTMPAAPTTFPTTAAYLWRPVTGGPSLHYDYNSSGTHNTVTGSAGSYTVTIPNATAGNASMMVTSYGGTAAAGPVCGITSWFNVTNGISAGVECRSAAGQLVESAFSFSYSTTGPALWQQGAHAWFNGTTASPSFSAALGKVTGCSAASVTGSGSPAVTMTVSGDLGSWDTSPFLRASLASRYGGAGYCKVESLTASGAAPSSTATTVLRCYDATGAAITAPRLTFTHVTSDASGPC